MRGYYFFMDQSEFTPPVRQSLTDQEISQQLGAATADEAGMLAAMDFLETQTALRNQDNQATELWIAKMQESSDPRASIALENFERAKQGLDALPLVTPVPEYPVFNSSTPAIEQVTDAVQPAHSVDQTTSDIPSAEPVAVDEFDTFIQPHQLTEPDVPVSTETLNVKEEPELAPQEIPAPVVRGFRLVSAANWIVGVGILAPALAAGISAVSGLNFVTSVLAGLVGVLVGLKVNVLGLITARRTNRGLAVASRATFGVFGAIVPGVALLGAGFAAVATIAFASGKYFNNTIVGLNDFSEPLFQVADFSITLGSTLAVALVTLASVFAIFGGSFSRWVRISIAALLLFGFVAYAILTISEIDYLNLAGVFQLEEFLEVAPVYALVVSVFTYGLDGESLAAAAWGAGRRTLTWPIAIFGFLLPLLTYGHLSALLNGHDFKDGFEVIQFLLSTGDQISSTILVDGSLLAVIGLLFIGISKLIEAIKTVGTNHIGYGLAGLAAGLVIVFVTSIAIFVANPLGLALNLTSVLLVTAAPWIGALLTETVMRRGRFHDASLTRSYGFYGAFNTVAILVYVLAVVAALSVAVPIDGLPWLGFLSSSIGFSCSITVAAFIAMGVSVLLTLLTGFPRIFRQQRETKSVEDRRFDLVDVVVD